MKLENFVSSCRRPTIINRRGSHTSVPCGRCPDCMTRRSSYYTDLITREASNHNYTLFFTLTYKESCVPKALITEVNRPVPDYPDATPLQYINLSDFTQRPLKKRKGRKQRWKKLPEYGDTLHTIMDTSFSDPLFCDFFQKTLIKPKNATERYNSFYRKNRVIRYLRKKDVQQFFKRLRSHIVQIFGKEAAPRFTYFITGEYGPITFRPHYHVVLFFDSPSLFQHIRTCVDKSWQLGKVYGLSVARDRDKCAQYVASYCNSFSHLPDYLTGKLIRPFSLHSKNFGTQIYSELRDYIYQDVRCAASDIDIALPSCSQFHFVPTGYNSRRLFPRCYNYVNQHPTDVYRLYTSYSQFAEKYDETNIARIAHEILTDFGQFENRLFLEALDIYVNIEDSSTQSKDRIEQYIILDRFTWYSDTLYNRVYMALYQSKTFLEFNCAKSPPREVIRLIKDYYDYIALVRLQQQYDSMIEYNKQTCSVDYDVFFHVQRDVVYQELYDEHPFISALNISKDYKYFQNVKHKELNDANLIFVNLKTKKHGKKSALSGDGPVAQTPS